MLKNLSAEMHRRGVSSVDVQRLIGCTDRTVRNKINGSSSFSFDEAQVIRDTFFSDLRLEYLFANDTRPKPKPA